MNKVIHKRRNFEVEYTNELGVRGHTYQQTNEQTWRGTYIRTHKQTCRGDVHTHERTYGGDVHTNERTNEQTNERTNKKVTDIRNPDGIKKWDTNHGRTDAQTD